jgi:hypothetical protein
MVSNIRAVLLGSSQALFLCDRPSRRSVDQIVVSEPGAMPRAIRPEFAVCEKRLKRAEAFQKAASVNGGEILERPAE